MITQLKVSSKLQFSYKALEGNMDWPIENIILSKIILKTCATLTMLIGKAYFQKLTE